MVHLRLCDGQAWLRDQKWRLGEQAEGTPLPADEREMIVNGIPLFSCLHGSGLIPRGVEPEAVSPRRAG
jgi:hypothetical protein